ncbi:hypothetical protein [Lactobacillus crispatus]|uniref:hypothetical protein n=1 Tax=Lactobacillus crispatus TaxID=47770 RepID=UPI0030FC2819
MVEYELKGLFNQNTLSTSDISNNNNYNNQQLFDHIIRGNANSGDCKIVCVRMNDSLNLFL